MKIMQRPMGKRKKGKGRLSEVKGIEEGVLGKGWMEGGGKGKKYSYKKRLMKTTDFIGLCQIF